MFCLSILCLFYIFAFLCFVVLCFVIDPKKHYVPVVYYCASVLSHMSEGWRHAFTYRRVKIYKSLFITYLHTYIHTYVCTRMYVCIYVFLFAYTGFQCSILYESTQYSISEYNYLVNRQSYEYIFLLRKKGKR